MEDNKICYRERDNYSAKNIQSLLTQPLHNQDDEEQIDSPETKK